jgi:hypothetical protein
MWVQKKMVPKCKLPKSIHLHAQELNYETYICELENHVGEEKLSSNWSSKLGLAKKTSSQVFPITYYKYLELNPHFPMPCHPTTRKRNTIRVAKKASVKLPQSTSPMLVYRMENKMPLIHHVVQQQECGCIIKDDEDLNEKIQRHPMMKPMSKLMEVGWEQVRVLSRDDHKGLD